VFRFQQPERGASVARVTKPRSFATLEALRAWLQRNHATRRELLVRNFKVRAAHRGVTYAQAVDAALCFGWIDGVRRSLDDVSFVTRLSPRKPKSKWSAVNVRRAKALIRAGQMRPPGLLAFRARDAADARRYSYESAPAVLAPGHARKLRASKRAWQFFRQQPPWYQRSTQFWVMSAKRDETRERRLAVLIACSAKRKTVPPLTRPGRRDSGG